MVSVYPVILSLGTNLGERDVHMRVLLEGVEELLAQPRQCSPLMETQPVGMAPETPWFLNCLVAGGYHGPAHELLHRCLALEQRVGRTRPSRWASRTGDVDILLFGAACIDEPDLCIPHPRIVSRRFCLEGLRSLVPTMVFPGTTTTIDRLYAQMDETVRNQQVRFLPATR